MEVYLLQRNFAELQCINCVMRLNYIDYAITGAIKTIVTTLSGILHVNLKACTRLVLRLLNFLLP